MATAAAVITELAVCQRTTPDSVGAIEQGDRLLLLMLMMADNAILLLLLLLMEHLSIERTVADNGWQVHAWWGKRRG